MINDKDVKFEAVSESPFTFGDHVTYQGKKAIVVQSTAPYYPEDTWRVGVVVHDDLHYHRDGEFGWYSPSRLIPCAEITRGWPES